MNALSVLGILLAPLNARRIPYQITGGLAGNFHGSLWPLHDIDVEIDADLDLVAEWFRPYVRWGPAHYQDDEFSLHLLQLRIHDIDVDINSIQDVILRGPAGEVAVATNLSRSLTASIHGLTVRVQPLEDLIRYKQILQRSADVADLESLRPTAPDPASSPG